MGSSTIQLHLSPRAWCGNSVPPPQQPEEVKWRMYEKPFSCLLVEAFFFQDWKLLTKRALSSRGGKQTLCEWVNTDMILTSQSWFPSTAPFWAPWSGRWLKTCTAYCRSAPWPQRSCFSNDAVTGIFNRWHPSGKPTVSGWFGISQKLMNEDHQPIF